MLFDDLVRQIGKQLLHRLHLASFVGPSPSRPPCWSWRDLPRRKGRIAPYISDVYRPLGRAN
jgi:hypothetical protein